MKKIYYSNGPKCHNHYECWFHHLKIIHIKHYGNNVVTLNILYSLFTLFTILVQDETTQGVFTHKGLGADMCPHGHDKHAWKTDLRYWRATQSLVLIFNCKSSFGRVVDSWLGASSLKLYWAGGRFTNILKYT